MHEKHHSVLVDMIKINPKWFFEFRFNGDDFVEITVSNSKEMSVSEEELEFQAVGKSLARTMKSLSQKLKGKDGNCKVCGGLNEEITIHFDGKEYRFTCYRIDSLKTKKKLKETNYQKFAEYLSPLIKKQQFLLSLIYAYRVRSRYAMRASEPSKHFKTMEK